MDGQQGWLFTTSSSIHWLIHWLSNGAPDPIDTGMFSQRSSRWSRRVPPCLVMVRVCRAWCCEVSRSAHAPFVLWNRSLGFFTSTSHVPHTQMLRATVISALRDECWNPERLLYIASACWTITREEPVNATYSDLSNYWRSAVSVTDCRGRLIQSMMPYWKFDWFRTLYSKVPYLIPQATASSTYVTLCRYCRITTMQSPIGHSRVIQSTLRQQSPTWCSTLLSLTWYKIKHASTTPKMFF